MILWLVVLTLLVAGIALLHVPAFRNHVLPERFLDWLAFEKVVIERHVQPTTAPPMWEIGPDPDVLGRLNDLEGDAKVDRREMNEIHEELGDRISNLASVVTSLQNELNAHKADPGHYGDDGITRQEVVKLTTSLFKDVKALMALVPDHLVEAGVQAQFAPGRVVGAYRPDWTVSYHPDLLTVREALPEAYRESGYHPVFDLWLLSHPKDEDPVDVVEVADLGTLTYTGVRVPSIRREKIGAFVYTGHRRV